MLGFLYLCLDAVNCKSHSWPAVHGHTSRFSTYCFSSCSRTLGWDSASSSWVNQWKLYSWRIYSLFFIPGEVLISTLFEQDPCWGWACQRKNKCELWTTTWNFATSDSRFPSTVLSDHSRGSQLEKLHRMFWNCKTCMPHFCVSRKFKNPSPFLRLWLLWFLCLK